VIVPVNGEAQACVTEEETAKKANRAVQGNAAGESAAVNISDVALIFEGGGMRASYTGGAVVSLLENNLNFGKVYGISAGASHSVNYISRDAPRAKASFVDLVKDPEFGGMKTFLKGEGYFNAHHLYEGIAEDLAGTDELFAFDWDAFCANPADIHIEAFDWDSAETVAWTKKDMPTMRDMMLRVRASSTMPIFMPPLTIDGHTYMDGGLGSSWGIPLEAAKRDGFKRFFIVRTQEKTYRKKPISPAVQRVFKSAFHDHPAIWQRTIERPSHYNNLCREIERLEEQGVAYVFYPEHMQLTNRTTNFDLLQAAFDEGYAQAQRELPQWKEWLFG
jgi:predicted patatin/cPLA2 family phospholipase